MGSCVVLSCNTGRDVCSKCIVIYDAYSVSFKTEYELSDHLYSASEMFISLPFLFPTLVQIFFSVNVISDSYGHECHDDCLL
jgi:hypothetical protein